MFTQRIDIDSPALIRAESKKALSFKEVKDSLVKFLMQAEIPFQGAERLPVVIDLKYNELGHTTKSELELNHHVSYKATVQLQGIKVNRRPVYVVAVPFELEELTHSERNKILAIQQTFNVIIFDERDWTKLGLDISEKNWLRPMTKKTLKSWARILFSKITDISGPSAVESDFTLNDLFSNIDKNVGSKLKKSALDGIKDLKLRLLRRELELQKGYKTLSNYQENLLTSFVNLDHSSRVWMEEIVTSVILAALKPVSTRRKDYKDFFRQVNGHINLVSSEKFTQLIYDYIKTNKKTLNVEVCGPSLITIQDKRTFQKLTLAITATQGKKSVTVSTKGAEKSGQDLGFIMELKFNNNSYKIEELNTYAICLAKSNHGLQDRLSIQSSLDKGIYMWSDIL